MRLSNGFRITDLPYLFCVQNPFGVRLQRQLTFFSNATSGIFKELKNQLVFFSISQCVFESLQITLKFENLPSTIEILKKTNIHLKSTIYSISIPKNIKKISALERRNTWTMEFCESPRTTEFSRKIKAAWAMSQQTKHIRKHPQNLPKINHYNVPKEFQKIDQIPL